MHESGWFKSQDCVQLTYIILRQQHLSRWYQICIQNL